MHIFKNISSPTLRFEQAKLPANVSIVRFPPPVLILSVIGFVGKQQQWGKTLQVNSELGVIATDACDCRIGWKESTQL